MPLVQQLPETAEQRRTGVGVAEDEAAEESGKQRFDQQGVVVVVAEQIFAVEEAAVGEGRGEKFADGVDASGILPRRRNQQRRTSVILDAAHLHLEREPDEGLVAVPEQMFPAGGHEEQRSGGELPGRRVGRDELRRAGFGHVELPEEMRMHGQFNPPVMAVILPQPQ